MSSLIFTIIYWILYRIQNLALCHLETSKIARKSVLQFTFSGNTITERNQKPFKSCQSHSIFLLFKTLILTINVESIDLLFSLYTTGKNVMIEGFLKPLFYFFALWLPHTQKWHRFIKRYNILSAEIFKVQRLTLIWNVTCFSFVLFDDKHEVIWKVQLSLETPLF